MAKKILVVDDEPGMVEVLRFRLNNAGYETLVATSGETAMFMAKSVKPDLVLLDVLLPDIEGWQVCSRIKTDKELAHTPVIIITASLFAENIDEKVKQYKADGYAIKPFDSGQLFKMIADLLAKSGA